MAYSFNPDPVAKPSPSGPARPASKRVVCAAIVRDGRLFAALRGHGAIGWELPGGKVEPHETPEEALRREIYEELSCRLSTMWYLDTVEGDETGFDMRLDCYVCQLAEGEEPQLSEHTDCRWLSQDELDSVGWLPSDARLARTIGLFWDQLFSPSHL